MLLASGFVLLPPDKFGCSVFYALGAMECPALLHGYLITLWFPLANDVLAQAGFFVDSQALIAGTAGES